MFIKEPCNVIGNIVEEISSSNENVKISFSNTKEITLSNLLYANLDFYIYKGKELSQFEFERLLELEKDSKGFNYLFKLVTSKYYPKKVLFEKLIKKGLKESSIEQMIDFLIEKGIYDPKNYLDNYVETYLEKGYSTSLIEYKLINLGYSKKEIKKVLDSKQEYKSNLIDVVSKLVEKYKNKDYAQLKNSVISKLAELGYSFEVSVTSFEKYMDENDDVKNEFIKKEEDNLKQMILTFIAVNKNLSSKEMFNKICARFIKKGYSYDKIKKTYKEVSEDVR